MIKFFRKIRQRLLSEGKIGKYLTYAIGEIVLVMIGILLALQFNNWNEDRKNEALFENYRMSLIEDLANDSTSLETVISNIENEKRALDEIKARVASSDAVLDTVLYIARFDYSFYIQIKSDFNDNTYSVLTSTGDISLFEKEIIDQLYNLNNHQKSAISSSNNTFENYRFNVHRYAQHYPVPFEYNLFGNETQNADVIWQDTSLRNHATEFNALIIAKGDSYRLLSRHLSLVRDATNELLAELRKLESE